MDFGVFGVASGLLYSLSFKTFMGWGAFIYHLCLFGNAHAGSCH